MRVHFIAIGGAVMHNLAITLHKKGYKVSGSDDEIFEPSKSRLASYSLLPEKEGWDAGRITAGIDTVILGMHARQDNPELIRARELGLKIMSFPEYLYEQTKDKKRIVVAGSHGKTTITAMIMHVFGTLGLKFDYMAGSMIKGYETMVGLHDDSGIAVFEGDEYLSSTLDPRPKFHLYKPDIAVINGIAWDHMNVFPTFRNYVEQFEIFITKISAGGCLIWYENDPVVKSIAMASGNKMRKIPYGIHAYKGSETGFFAVAHGRSVPLKIFGEHNMQNLMAAKQVCLVSGVREDDFYDAIRTFGGTSKRLQLVGENENGAVYLDFAHAPSKVKATVGAVATRYPGRELIACLELHTYSSLNIEFIPQYRGTLDKATLPVIYFNPHALELKKLPHLDPRDIRKAFGEKNINVFNNSEEMSAFILKQNFRYPVYLFMSSGDYDGLNLKDLTDKLLLIK